MRKVATTPSELKPDDPWYAAMERSIAFEKANPPPPLESPERHAWVIAHNDYVALGKAPPGWPGKGQDHGPFYPGPPCESCGGQTVIYKSPRYIREWSGHQWAAKCHRCHHVRPAAPPDSAQEAPQAPPKRGVTPPKASPSIPAAEAAEPDTPRPRTGTVIVVDVDRMRELAGQGKGLRTIAAILERETGTPVSHMTVKRNLQRGLEDV